MSTASSSAAPTTSAAAVATASSASSAAGSAGSSAASAPAATSGSGAVTFDGSYSGTLTTIVCVGSGSTTTASFKATFTGTPDSYPGDIAASEFGFQGPDNTEFDSGFLKKALDSDGKGFVVDGIVAKDSSGKSVTMHGTLVCP
ncbi:MAG TPA: hypothetical protein VFG00_04960 [Acidothermaceae bacterium]|nr:hypothetical protein [Acidothermaceae bacterium]